MPDMSGKPRGICHPATSGLLDKDDIMETDLTKTLHGSSPSWVSQTPKLSLNCSEEEDLQKAIALSLEENSSGSLTKSKKLIKKIEEEDLARALAESISDLNKKDNLSKSIGIGYHCTDLKLLLRKDKDWPVGLQNVGNSCWFNVVIQSLFHLPLFRSLVFQFASSPNNSGLSNKTQQSLHLVHELRCLFALMLASKRSFINPGKLVNIFQDSTNQNRQEDASEFIHRLLEQLEEGFRYDKKVKSKIVKYNDVFVDSCDPIKDKMMDRNISNPMLEMFYGTYKSYDDHNGAIFEQEHQFSILPICVKSQFSLHRSLENATVKESNNRHEVWFTQLPSVLIFQLSRFQFNQDLQITEKIHDPLSFPSVIYMDRYLEVNKDRTKFKREEAERIRSELEVLKTKLNRFLNYPAGGNHCLCLSDVLACCAEFASEMATSDFIPDSSMPIVSTRRRLGSTSPSGGLFSCKRSKEGCNSQSVFKSSDAAVLEPTKITGPLNALTGHHQSHPGVQEEEMVESVLRKWKRMVDQEIADLKMNIISNQQRLDRLFEEPSLHNHPYSLHAVLVHAGQALAGHYWAYIRDYVKERWLKYNDISVTEATFEQLNADSVGSGYIASAFDNNSSAYCLIYTNNKNSNLLTGSNLNEISNDALLHDLIQDDHQKLENELHKLKKDQLLKEIRTEDLAVKKIVDAPWDLQSLRQAIDKVSDMDADQAVKQVVREEYNRLKLLSEKTSTLVSDVRLLNIVVYLFQNGASEKLIERCLLEQFTDPRLKYEARSHDIMRRASVLLDSLSSNELLQNDYETWHRYYLTFRTAVYHLIEGIKLFQNGLYYDCVCHLVAAHKHNRSLLDSIHPRLTVDVRFIESHRRNCIKKIHEETILLVKSDNVNHASDGLCLLRSKLIPCMSVLLSPDRGGDRLDIQLADTIRDQWCSLLEKSLVISREQLSEALTEFLDTNPTSVKSITAPDVENLPANLNHQYEEIMTHLQY